MAKLSELYKKAKAAGYPTSEIRGKSASEIEELLANGGGTKTTAKKKSVVKKAVAVAKKKRGRPAGSKNKAKAVKAVAEDSEMSEKQAKRILKKYEGKRGRRPAEYHQAMEILGVEQETKPTKKTAKKNSTKKVSSGNGDGRHLLSGVDYDKTKGWNPREGSPPDRIIKALKRFKGDREKVFNHLESDVWDFVGKVKRNGDKRTVAEAKDFLRYRIASTDWRFAIQTNQHKKATDRAEYGSGSGTTTTTKKKRGRPAKASKAASSLSNADVKEMSDQALRKVVKAVEGKRGRPSTLVLAARKELERRAKGKGRAAKKKAKA